MSNLQPRATGSLHDSGSTGSSDYTDSSGSISSDYSMQHNPTSEFRTPPPNGDISDGDRAAHMVGVVDNNKKTKGNWSVFRTPGWPSSK